MDHLFRDVVTEAKSLIGAQVLSLFLVMDSTSQSDKDKDGHGATAMKGKKYFLAKYANGIISDENVLRSPLGPGVKSRVVRTGEVVNLVEYVFDIVFCGFRLVC